MSSRLIKNSFLAEVELKCVHAPKCGANYKKKLQLERKYELASQILSIGMSEKLPTIILLLSIINDQNAFAHVWHKRDRNRTTEKRFCR